LHPTNFTSTWPLLSVVFLYSPALLTASETRFELSSPSLVTFRPMWPPLTDTVNAATDFLWCNLRIAYMFAKTDRPGCASSGRGGHRGWRSRASYVPVSQKTTFITSGRRESSQMFSVDLSFSLVYWCLKIIKCISGTQYHCLIRNCDGGGELCRRSP
jgi:hypothetical protein